MSQSDHEKWNASNYPGTLQLCDICDSPTGRCEDDSLYADDEGEVGPLCEVCWTYETRVRAMEADGMTRSDAQALIDGEDIGKIGR